MEDLREPNGERLRRATVRFHMPAQADLRSTVVFGQTIPTKYPQKLRDHV